MGLVTGAKHKMYVSAAAPGSFDKAGWEAVAGWELAPCPESLPELIKRFEEVTYTCLHSGTTESARGVAEIINWAPAMKDEPSDPGQIIIKNAFDAVNGTPAELISIKLENASGTQQVYAQAKVLAYGVGERVSNTVVMRVVEFSIDAGTMHEENA